MTTLTSTHRSICCSMETICASSLLIVARSVTVPLSASVMG